MLKRPSTNTETVSWSSSHAPYLQSRLTKKLISLVNQIMWPIIAQRVTDYSAARGLGLGDQSEEFFDKNNCGMAPPIEAPACPLTSSSYSNSKK